jgi:SNF2 family DNA or RNA helicase
MVKIYQLEEDARKGKVTVQFHSRYNFYEVLNRIKKFPARLVKRQWKLPVHVTMELLAELSELKKETVHVDFGIFSYFFAARKYRKKLIQLRNTLDGIDSEVKMAEGYNLLPFQHVAVEFIKTVKFGLIADKVGLGKTIEAACSAVGLYENGECEKAIVVVPSSLKKKWKTDVENKVGWKAVILEGFPSSRQEIYENWMNGDDLFLIVSYDTLRIDWEKYIKNFIPKLFCLIFDEVQKMKNKWAKRSIACKEIADHKLCTARMGLSATYIETGLQDMFGAMLVIDENVFGISWTAFADQYLDISYMGKIQGGKNIPIAREKMKTVSVRRRKPQVKDQLSALLPEVNENTIWLELTKHQKKLYNNVLENVIDKIESMEKAGQVNTATAMTELILLRQVCLSTELFKYDPASSTKVDALKDMLPEIIEENKVVIFCHFTGFVDIMERELLEEGIKCIVMHGKRTEGKVQNRQDNIDWFSESKDTNVLITSDILAEGVDIPAASYVINTDILWNPAKMTQRAGRIDRLNQKAKTIYVVNLLTEGSLEEEMYNIVYERYNLALQVMDDGQEEKRIKRLSFSDIKRMLRKVR